MVPFGERLAEACRRVNVPLAIGLDPHLDRIPAVVQARRDGLTGAAFRALAAAEVRSFGAQVVEAIAGRVAAIKPQVAFFEQLGAPGMAALEAVCADARAAGLLVIADAKRGDISSTAAAYARAYLVPDAPFAADALTVSPYLGLDTLEPFLAPCRAHGGGLFVLVRTTNPGSAALQHAGQPPLAEVVAAGLHLLGGALCGPSGLSSLGAVVGASASDDARRLRALLPQAWFLVPGLGAQGGTAAQALAGARADGLGALPVASRSVLFAPAGGPPDADPVGAIAARADALAAELRGALRLR